MQNLLAGTWGKGCWHGDFTVWKGASVSLYVVVENTLNESCARPASAARHCHSVPITRNAATATWTGFCHPKTGATTSSVWLL